jgi:hypothetical protein
MLGDRLQLTPCIHFSLDLGKGTGDATIRRNDGDSLKITRDVHQKLCIDLWNKLKEASSLAQRPVQGHLPAVLRSEPRCLSSFF